MAAPSNDRKKASNNDRRNIWLLVITTLLVIGSIIMFMPPQEKINQGLDIQGALGRLDLAGFVEEVHPVADAPAVYVRLTAGGPFPTVQFDWETDHEC